MMNFVLSNEKLCNKNEKLCIKNGEFCRLRRNRQGPPDGGGEPRKGTILLTFAYFCLLFAHFCSLVTQFS